MVRMPLRTPGLPPAIGIYRVSKLYDSPDTSDDLCPNNIPNPEGMGMGMKFYFGRLPGLSACPGRFFTTSEIKLKDRTGRTNGYDGTWCFPDTGIFLLFQPRKFSGMPEKLTVPLF